MGLSIATAMLISTIVGGISTGASLIVGSRNQRKATQAAERQAQAVQSLAPTTTEQDKVALDAEAKLAKESADKRASDREAAIKADTERRARSSISGLSSTVRTSARGLTTIAPTEKKTLLGQGGLR